MFSLLFPLVVRMASGLRMGCWCPSGSRETGPEPVSSCYAEPWLLNGLSRDLPYPAGFLGVQLASTSEGFVQWTSWSILSESHHGLGVPLFLTQVPLAFTAECVSHPPSGHLSKLYTPSSLHICPRPGLSTLLPTRNMRAILNF